MHKTLATNPHAKRNYDLTDTFEAGLELLGVEIKSLRSANAQLAGAHITVKDGEAWLINAYIAPYAHATQGAEGYDARRPRKLLLHRAELDRMTHKVERQRLAIVPIAIHLKGRLAKLQFGIGKGRRKADRRDAIIRKETQRHKERQWARRERGQ